MKTDTIERLTFEINELNNCNLDDPEHIFLIFLPDFWFYTPIHSLIVNYHYKLFNDLVDKVEINLKKIIEFIESDQFLDKIIDMFNLILENRRCYPKDRLEAFYCDLLYERNFFDDEYDEDFSEDDDDLMDVVTKKRSRKTTGSIFNQNVNLMKKLLKMINVRIQSNVRFLKNNHFRVLSF